MGRKNLRTLEMKENFLQHREDKKSISEIAQIYNLCPDTVYKTAREISKETGIPLEELLPQPHSKHSQHPKRGKKEVAEYEEVKSMITVGKQKADRLLTKLSQIN